NIGLCQGDACPNLFRHPERKIVTSVHGDDFTSSGPAGALDWLEAKTGKPVLAVLPYLHNLHIEAEDAVAQQQLDSQNQQLKVVVPIYPRASNHTDFDALRMHPQVDCQLLRDINQFQGADLIILPGSKNTRGDLAWFKQQGWGQLLQRHLRLGGKVMGICGGYQMLGQWIHDPHGSESTPGSCQGLGLLAIATTLQGEKQLRNVQGHWAGLHADDTQATLSGYEIHVGTTTGPDTEQPLVYLQTPGQTPDALRADGARNADNTVMGSYVHGILDQTSLLNSLLTWAGVEAIQAFDYQAHRASEIDRLADATEAALPVSKLHELLNWPPL
ncbi:MAG: cobyric acid synthase, partial [Gammaproteobacteria bacterium]|nr:cobyric acid synthase [Gammaproteobacteria bacterium]